MSDIYLGYEAMTFSEWMSYTDPSFVLPKEAGFLMRFQPVKNRVDAEV